MKRIKTSKIEYAVIAILVSIITAQCIAIGKSKMFVREPQTPLESSLSYVPPPPPKYPLEAVKEISLLKNTFTPKVVKVGEDIYQAQGFALANVQMVVTDEGVVIIDTTESVESAKEVLSRFRKITDKPIRYIIYTHSHLDHIQGAAVFFEEGTQVIAAKAALDYINMKYGWLGEYENHSRRNQAGLAAPDFAVELPLKSPLRGLGSLTDIIWPMITFEDEYSFELGGKKFELYHTQGETPDHLMVWLPQQKALFCGDLYYASFPNLSSPMMESRPVREWYESLDRMIAMKPQYLLPGHTGALVGTETISQTLSNYSKAIRYVYEATVKGINDGKTVNEIVQTVKLPDELTNLPYLREYYGRVDWSIRGIYRGLTGWYDGHGTGLIPLPPHIKAREIVNLSGGADKILTRAIELQKAGEHQLVCELCDIVISANPNDKLAHLIKAYSLDYLGIANFNLNTFGFYRSAASLERQSAGVKPK